MTRTTTQIHPDYPICWEDTTTLRFGFERAAARVCQPSASMQRLIGALRGGVETSRLMREARAMGATPREAHSLLDALAPVLLQEPRPREDETVTPGHTPSPAPGPVAPQPMRTRVCDEGREVEGLRASLLATGTCTLDWNERRAGIELAVLVERFLEPLERAQRWLSEAVPHLPIRFSDRAVHIGPLIVGNGAPCHTCMALELVDRDPVLPILATQLHGKRPSSETTAGAHMAAAVAAVFVRAWWAGDPFVHRSCVVIPMSRGRVSGFPRSIDVRPHPDCACDGRDAPADRSSANDARLGKKP